MSDVFVSYSRVDRANAQALVDALRGHGLAVWFDADLEWGAPNFAAIVGRELAAARCIVVLWTATSVKSDWVIAEVTEAQRLRKILLPVVIDDAAPPLPFNVMQSEMVSSRTAGGDQLARVVAAVAARLANAQPLMPVAPARPVLKPRSLGGRRLDARRDSPDVADLHYLPAPSMLAPVFPPASDLEHMMRAHRNAGLVLDAGREGACAAFAAANVANWLLLIRHAGSAWAGGPQSSSFQMLRHFGSLVEGPSVDEWGMSCRSVLAAWRQHGLCDERRWPFDPNPARGERTRAVDGWQESAQRRPLTSYYRIRDNRIADMQAALSTIGALLVSVVAHDGWSLAGAPFERKPSFGGVSFPVIGPPRGDLRAGHAVAVVGYNEHGFVVLNAWGPHWGRGGFAVLTYAQWQACAMDAWLPVVGAPILLPREDDAGLTVARHG